MLRSPSPADASPLRQTWRAGRWAEELKDQAERHSLESYYPCALGFKGKLSAEHGDVMTAVQLLRAALEGLRETNYLNFYTVFATDLALSEAEAGRLDQGLAAIDKALPYAGRTEELCYLPEILRVKGELLLMAGKSNATVAEDDFSRSFDLARRHGALSWELRSTTSLARLRRDQGHTHEARDLLAPVHDRFTEGFATADLKAAKQLLNECSRT